MAKKIRNMKTLVESCKKILSNGELAKLHNLPIEYVEYELRLGIIYERLSVSNIDVAETFARKNLERNPHYYESFSELFSND